MLERINPLLAALLLAALVVIVAQAISPYQPRQEQGQPQRGKDAESQQGIPNVAAPSESGIQIECDPNCSAKESEEHKNESWTTRFIRKSIDDPLATFTGILALATLVMALYTATVARATKAAAEHIPTVEGAYLYVVLEEEMREMHRIETSDGDGKRTLQIAIGIRIAVENFGKTPAVIERFRARLSYVSGQEQIFGLEAALQANTVIGAGKSSDDQIISSPILSAEQAARLREFQASLVMTGDLVYRDIWGEEWTVPFDGRNNVEGDRSFRIDNRPRQKSA